MLYRRPRFGKAYLSTGCRVIATQPREAAARHLNAHVRLEFNIPAVPVGGRYDGSPIVPDGSTRPPDAPNTYVRTACPAGRPPHAWLEDGRSFG